MKKFYIKDCPDRKTMHMWIAETLDMQKYVDGMKPENDGVLFEFSDSKLNVNTMINACNDAYEKFGWFGFLDIYGTKFNRQPNYGGLSLVYNPNYRYDNIPHNAQTLGYPRNNIPDELFYENFELFEKIMEKRLDKDVFSVSQEFGTHAAFKLLLDNSIIDNVKYTQLITDNPDRKDVGERINKDCYPDTWGFNHWSEPAQYGYLGEVSSRVKRTPVRSRLAQLRNIDTDEMVQKANTYLWHRDESWFYELRINLSLENHNDAYGIEIENYGQKSFTPGNWYVWDTYATHRPYVNQAMPGKSRINYILAVNPWFDFNYEEQCWEQNEFYGEKHPVDMVIDGDVIEGLDLVK
jgi:hypothetical protein